MLLPLVHHALGVGVVGPLQGIGQGAQQQDHQQGNQKLGHFFGELVHVVHPHISYHSILELI